MVQAAAVNALLQVVLQSMLSMLSVMHWFLWKRRDAVNRMHRILVNEDGPSTIGALRGPRYRRQVRALLARRYWYALSGARMPRRWWVYPRSHDWWNNFVLDVCDDEEWLRNFRMTKRTMDDLVKALSPKIKRQQTNMRHPIPTAKRVAMTVWWLANVTSYREVSQQFGVGISTVASIVAEVCRAMELLLLPQNVCLGDPGKIMDGFRQLGFPHCIGAVCGTHIVIRASKAQAEDDINRKSTFSVLLQGTTDHTGRFIDIAIDHSGRNHASIFKESALCVAMDAGAFVPHSPTIRLGGVTIPPLIVADASYPIREWLMKPYGGGGDRRRMLFDQCLSRARNVVECAFGRLKARWRCLSSRLNVAPENVTAVVSACVILHNICEDKGHEVIWDPREDGPIMIPCREEAPQQIDRRQKAAGTAVRDAIADFLLSTVPERP